MVVVEAPGTVDDKHGEPFHSTTLKAIKHLFEQNGVKAHFTYAVKCAKPDRSTEIKGDWVKTCRTEHLSQEIALIKPKHIICLGSNAVYAALGRKKKIEEFRGARFLEEKSGTYFYITYHQNQTLYNVTQKLDFWNDLNRFIGWIKGEGKEQKFDPKLYFVHTLAGLRKIRDLILAHDGPVAVDTETTGLNPYAKNGHVRTIQFCWDEEFGGVAVPLWLIGYWGGDKKALVQYWQDESIKEAIEIIREILAKKKIIWHNGKFDRIWLYCWGIRMTGKPIFAPRIYMDTMHVAHLLNENRKLGLKKLITEEFGFETYDISDKLTLDLDKLVPYAAKDTVAALLLARKYEADLQLPENARLFTIYTKIVRPMDSLFTKMEIRGWPGCSATAKAIKKRLQDKLGNIQAKMLDYLEQKGIEGIDETHFASTTKLEPLLFEVLGLPVSTDTSLAYTPKGKRSTGEDALVHLKETDKFVQLLFEWRGVIKLISTYIEPMIREIENWGAIRTQYKLTGTVTGRTASGGWQKGVGMNLQNVPYDEGVKTIIQPTPEWLESLGLDPNEEYVVLSPDFSQIELRIAAEMSKDPALVENYKKGDDLHTFRAQRIYAMGTGREMSEFFDLPKAEQKQYRTDAKPNNFGYLYGMSWKTFVVYAWTTYGIHFPNQTAKDMREDFFTTHYGLPTWYKQMENEGKKFGYVTNLIGRRRRLPNIKLDPEQGSDARQKYSDAVRQAINSPVQGFGSDMKLMAMIQIDRELDDGYNLLLIGEVHDSIVMIARKAVVVEYSKRIQEIMEKPEILEKHFGVTLEVPIEASAEVGQTYGDLVPVEEWLAAA